MLGSNFGAGPPTNFAVVVLDYNAVSLSWSAPTTAPDWYEVEVRPSGGTWNHIISVYGTSYDLAGLNAATAYDFRVRGVKATWPLWKYGPYASGTATTDAYRAADYTVTNDATWTTAAAAAIKGEIIEITAGVSLNEKTCPNPATGTGFLTIRSSAMASLPGWDKRVGVGDLANMPTFYNDSNANAAMWVTTDTDHVSFEGIAFRAQQLSGSEGYVVRVFGTQDTYSDVQFHRCYVDSPVPTGGILKTATGISLSNAIRFLIKDLYIKECTGASGEGDTQGILGTANLETGINNCHVEGGAENIMFGGVTHAVEGLIPDLITIRRCVLFKPRYWQASDPSYDGVNRTIKNHFEVKYGSRILFEDNLCLNMWFDEQFKSITITPRSQAGAMPWIADEHIQIRYNIIKDFCGGIGILGADDTAPSGSEGYGTRWLSVYHNLWDGLADDISERWVGIDLHKTIDRIRPRDIAIFKNTVIPSGTFAQFWINSPKDVAAAFADNRGILGELIFRDNIVPYGTGSSAGLGTDGDGAAKDGMINTYGALANIDWQKNVQYGDFGGNNKEANYPGQYHAINGEADVGFTNYAGGDYTLTPESAYIAAASDGGPCGADVAAVMARTLHCEDGDWT